MTDCEEAYRRFPNWNGDLSARLELHFSKGYRTRRADILLRRLELLNIAREGAEVTEGGVGR